MFQISFQVETTRKIVSFHREDKNADPNNPQSILLDFISSCQNLRIWSLNTITRECLNSEQLQKGKQIDEWWRQASKGTCCVRHVKLLSHATHRRSVLFYFVEVAHHSTNLPFKNKN